MYILLFSLWIVFNAHITFEIVVFGLFFSSAIFWFLCTFMDYSIRKDRKIVTKVFYIVHYIAVLLVEIVKANIGSIRFVLDRKNKPKPLIVKFRSGLTTQTARVLLANSITLTPGTITISLDNDIFTVHCLDASMADGLQDSRLACLLRKMEEVAYSDI